MSDDTSYIAYAAAYDAYVDALGIRQPGLSQQLAALREAGLIEIESAPPRGNFVKKPL